jgi:hypothetical protein
LFMECPVEEHSRLTTTHHQRRFQKIAERRLVHAMLDGVLKCRNNFFDIRRQLATALDVWPQRDRRRENHRAVQCDRIKIVVEISPPTAMKGVARLPHAGRQSFQ